jgi:hypothetical protein
MQTGTKVLLGVGAIGVVCFAAWACRRKKEAEVAPEEKPFVPEGSYTINFEIPRETAAGGTEMVPATVIFREDGMIEVAYVNVTGEWVKDVYDVQGFKQCLQGLDINPIDVIPPEWLGTAGYLLL